MSKVFNVFDTANYSGGQALPDNDYALWFEFKMWKSEQSKEPPRLGVMITAQNLHDPKETKEKFLSMGTGADKSFAPNPADSGMSLVPIAGAPAQTLNNQTNWFLFMESLKQCGLPEDTDDLSTIQGMWVHIANVPEPESRKDFGSKKASTAEVAQAQPERKAGTTIVVTHIHEEGMPWNGTGGQPDGPQTLAMGTPPADEKPAVAGKPAVARKPAVAGKPAAAAAAAKPAGKPKPGKPGAAAPPAEVEGDPKQVAEAAFSKVLMDGTNAKGMPWLKFRTQVFTAAKNASNDEMASAVTAAFLEDQEAANAILGELGYQIAGGQVKQA